MQDFDWENNVTNREQKEEVAKKILSRVKDGDVIGFGSGTTSYIAIKMIAKKVKEEGLKIKAIPTSTIIKELCNKLEIETTTLEENKPDWCFDGADEVDKNNNLIKGLGAALYKEKLNFKSSDENYVLVDESKFVDRLGQNHPVPVECDIEKVENIKMELMKLGAKNIELRVIENTNEPLITDNGKVLLFAYFDEIKPNYEELIKNIEGVLESGLFIGYNVIIVK